MGLWTLASSVVQFRFDSRFTDWLFTKVDQRNQIVLDCRNTYSIGPDDVALVFGLISRGKPVISSVKDKTSATKNIILSRIKPAGKEEPILTSSLKVISERMADTSQGGSVRFKTAFAIYLLNILVGPHDYNGDNSANFIPALKDIDHFVEFNWAEYIFDEISIDVLNARCARKAKKEFLLSFGSALFLNVSPLHLSLFSLYFFWWTAVHHLLLIDYVHRHVAGVLSGQ